MRIRIVAVWMLAALCAVAGASDVREQNKKIASRVFDEMFTQGHFERVTELYSASFVNHGLTRDIGLEEDQAAAQGWKKAFPDLVMSPELTVAEGDLVAVLWRAKGTNTGEGNGLPATGRSGQGRGITIWKIVDGKITEEWSEFSTRSMLLQLGLVPGAPPVPEKQEWWPTPVFKAGAGVPPAGVEENRRIAKSVFEEILGKGRFELFDSIYDSSFADHGVNREFRVQDELEASRGFRQLAPDLKVDVTMTVAEGDFVTVVYTASGTNTGAAMGYAATSKPFRLRGMSIFRIKDGRITDEWSELDPSRAFQEQK